MKITNFKKTQEEIQKEIENTMMEKHGRVYKFKKYSIWGRNEIIEYSIEYTKGKFYIQVYEQRHEIRKNKLNDLKKIL